MFHSARFTSQTQDKRGEACGLHTECDVSSANVNLSMSQLSGLSHLHQKMRIHEGMGGRFDMTGEGVCHKEGLVERQEYVAHEGNKRSK